MTPIQLALLRAQDLLLARIAELGTRIAEGDETAWSPFCEAARALAAIAPQTVPEARQWQAFRLGLRERGWIEGENILIESRWAERNLARVPNSRPTWFGSRWT